MMEKYFLSYCESAIIAQLRSEHIGLGLYNHVIFHEGDGNCKECEVYETVRHFLIDCERFSEQRKELRKKLIDLNQCYEKDKCFNAKRILFPHRSTL